MLNATWRRLGSPAWLVIGLIVLIPTMAEAQLFPNRTIRRERPPCVSEPPFNAQVRRDYFGYYPTCWSRFPAGWQCPCPNPELPNLAESITKYGELGKKRKGVEDETRPPMDEENPDAPADGMRGNPAGDNPIPLPNGGRSPFDLDPSPKPPATDPFAPATPPAAPGGRPGAATSAGLLEMPKLPATSPTASNGRSAPAGAIAMAPDATLTSGDSADLRPDLGPLPTAPQPGSTVTPPSSVSDDLPNVGTPAPAQAPRRQGLLGRLFGGNPRNR